MPRTYCMSAEPKTKDQCHTSETRWVGAIRWFASSPPPLPVSFPFAAEAVRDVRSRKLQLTLAGLASCQALSQHWAELHMDTDKTYIVGTEIPAKHVSSFVARTVLVPAPVVVFRKEETMAVETGLWRSWRRPSLSLARRLWSEASCCRSLWRLHSDARSCVVVRSFERRACRSPSGAARYLSWCHRITSKITDRHQSEFAQHATLCVGQLHGPCRLRV